MKKYRIIIAIMFLIIAMPIFSQGISGNYQTLDDNCPDTMQYLPAGMDVHYAPRINPGVISNGYVDPSVITNLHTFYMALLQTELPTSSLLSPLPDLDEIEEAPTPIQLTGNYQCARDGITGVFREVQSDNSTQWIIEAIFIEEFVLSNEIIEEFTIEVLDPMEMAPENTPQAQFLPSTSISDRATQDELTPLPEVQAPDTTPILNNTAFYFWEIYDPTPFDGPGSVLVPGSLPHQYCDDYTAFSYLSVGQQAQLSGYYYSRYPLAGDLVDIGLNNWLDLGNMVFNTQYAFDFFTEMLKTNMYEPAPTSYNKDIQFYGGAQLVTSHGVIFAPPQYGAPVATIVDGPACRSYDIRNYQECTNANPCEYGDNPDDRYAIWWEIELTVHGETYRGWYPENVTQYAWWLYEDYGIFDQAATAYLLTPYGHAMTVTDECEQLPSSRYPSGLGVQPATGAMNIRDSANGNIIGRVEPNSIMTLIGEPECEDGIRWREVIFNDGSISSGWIAENDDTIFYITTYTPPIETVEPEPTRESGNSSENTPHNTHVPDSTSNTASSPTPGLVIPVVPATARPTGSSCDPATGRNC